MGKTDKRIDHYIAGSAVFARPILNHLRLLVQTACPEAEETIKWGFPHFMFDDRILCSMASFKQHCSFIFWQAEAMEDPQNILEKVGRTAMGHLGRITTLSELPPDHMMKAYIRESARLIQEGVKPPAKPRPKPGVKKSLAIPDYFRKALAANKKALKTFEAFSATNKKDYLEWVEEAKTEPTRNKRLSTAIEWMSEGKPRNWKYMK
jgi:uncharacterized protein YdeI (YjbR/CyaY-like superfamily)